MRTKNISRSEDLEGAITVTPTSRGSNKATSFDLKTDRTHIYFKHVWLIVN